MVRVKKKPEVRRAELIDTALELFSSAGYEKTKIFDIVQKAGVAKGTFFYYFPTKEAVLEAICTRWATELVASLQWENRQLCALDKLQAFIVQLFCPSQLDAFVDRLWAEEQFNLLNKTWQQHIEPIFNPLLTAIIRQGNQEETMHVLYPQETIDFLWTILNCLWETTYLRQSSETFHNKIKIAEAVLEELLGSTKGSIRLPITQS